MKEKIYPSGVVLDKKAAVKNVIEFDEDRLVTLHSCDGGMETSNGAVIAQIRDKSVSNFGDVSIWLDDDYDWVIVKDCCHQLCLVPSKKK